MVYGVGHYSSDDSTDTQSIIDTSEMSGLLETIITELVDLWHKSDQENNTKPSFKLSKADRDSIMNVAFKKVAESTGLVRNIRLWNEDQDDNYVR